MPSDSFWLRSSLPQYAALEQDLSADAVIVGGGLAGLLTALLLKQSGLDVVVLEGGRIGHGASGHTTAKVTAQHGPIYAKLIEKWGKAAARRYAQVQLAALSQMHGLTQALELDCDWVQQPACLFATTPQGEKVLEKEARAYQQMGLIAQYKLAETALPLPVRASLTLQDQAAFHPVKFMGGIAQALCKDSPCIYEHSRVLSVDVQQNIVYTDKAKVQAKWVVIATHYPIINLPGLYFARLKVERSCAMLLRGAPQIDTMAISVDPTVLSLRMADGNLLLGGANYPCGRQGKVNHYKMLEETARKYFPAARPMMVWSAQDAMPPDDLPFVGAYSKATPRLLVATGFGKWGMTNSMAAARLLQRRVLGKKDAEMAMLSPQRTGLHAAAGVAGQVLSTAGGMASGVGRLFNPACTHMGCRLSWNQDEQSWDCPCHGSRFEKSGDVLEGPAVKGLRV